MLFEINSHLPVWLPSKFNDIIPDPAVSFLSSISMTGSNSEGTTQQSNSAIITAQALETARDTPEGAQDPTVIHILESALAAIWRNIEIHPTSYVMTRDEFAVFNYFAGRFTGQPLATAAIKRYWDHLDRANGR